jgi:excinuclease ABC subunit C
VVNRHFKLRTCSDQVLASRRRPCLQYQIKRCDAPCVFPVPEEEYADQVRDVALFLEGKDQELVERLRARMKDAAQHLEFERAAAVRDQIASLEKTLTEQRVVAGDLRDQDVFGLHREGSAIEIAVLHIRQGKLLGRRTFHFTGQEFPDEETLSSFVSLYYDLGGYVPDEVLLPCSIEDADTKGEWLRERRAAQGQPGSSRARAVAVLHPQRGPRAKLVELANKNAQASYASRRDRGEDVEAALGKMKERLGLKRLPRRIECYDISHIQGTATVASMVVFEDGEPARSQYRRFKIRSVENDDFKAMYEVLSRRFRRARGEDAERWRPPDLVVIDGGKGQLGAAMAALRDVKADLGTTGIDVIGLAKERAQDASAADIAAQHDDAATQQEGAAPGRKRAWRRGRGSSESEGHRPDRVFLPRIKDPIPLRPHTAELHVLSRIRDEAHRFAITFHRQLRGSRTLRSALADIPGVGEKRQRELLRHFGSLKRVREASVDELAAVSGMTGPAAEAVRAFFLAGQAPAAHQGGGERDAAAAYAALQHAGGSAPARAPRAPADDDLQDAAADEITRLAGDEDEGGDDEGVLPEVIPDRDEDGSA